MLKRWSFLEILELAGRLAIIVAVIMFFTERGERRKAKHYQAWQVINAAQGKPGSGGRIDALQDLNKDSVSLSGIDLSNAYLSGIDIRGANLSKSNFSKANLNNSNLSNSDCWKSDFSEAYLINATLSKSDLSYANLSKTEIYHANFSRTCLKAANFYEASNYESIHIPFYKHYELVKNGEIETELAFVNFKQARLMSAIFIKAKLGRADFSEAKLQLADFSMALLPYANLTKAILSDTNFNDAFLLSTNLSRADLSGANLSEAFLMRANLKDIVSWKNIRSIKLANIYGIKNPPDGFVEWAKENGAVSIENYEEWKKLIEEKTKEQKVKKSNDTIQK